jgi:transposase
LAGRVNDEGRLWRHSSLPTASGRRCGSELAGQRAAIVMSLVQSAKLDGHDPWAHLRDVLERLPSHPNSCIDELLPHRWSP